MQMLFTCNNHTFTKTTPFFPSHHITPAYPHALILAIFLQRRDRSLLHNNTRINERSRLEFHAAGKTGNNDHALVILLHAHLLSQSCVNFRKGMKNISGEQCFFRGCKML